MSRLLLLALLVLPAASAAMAGGTPKATLQTRICANAKVQWTGKASARPRNLGELPPGNLMLTVMRDVDGCIEPAFVGYGYGAVGAREDEMHPGPRPR